MFSFKKISNHVKQKPPFLYGWKCGKIKKETTEMINTRLRIELLLKDEEIGRGARETSKEDKVCFVLKVLDGILGG